MGGILSKIKSLYSKVSGFFLRGQSRKFVYAWFYKRSRIKQNRFLFESSIGKTVSDSPLALLKALVESDTQGKYDIYYSTRRQNYEDHKRFIDKTGLPVKLVTIDSLKYVRLLATSRYLVNNNSFPAYFIRREGQNYLQTWHGTPLKTLGKEMRNGIESMHNVQHNFLQADYIMFPNEFTKKVIMRDYNLDHLYTGKTVMSGYPRNTIFLSHEQEEGIRERYSLTGKTVYAYMPTWRGTSNHNVDVSEFADEMDRLFTYLDERLKDDQVLFVNFHMMYAGKIQLNAYRHIKSFPVDVNNYEFLSCADALVTDYSSVFFDFSITRKPILLYIYDYDQYMRDRGMYLDIKELPFKKVYDIEELSGLLVSEEILNCGYSDSDWVNEFTRYDSADASKKLVKLLLTGETELEIEDYGFNKIPEHRVLRVDHISGKEEFENLKSAVKENDIVLFNRAGFDISQSRDLYDTCNYDFDYVFSANTVPRTVAEELLFRAGDRKTADIINKRNIKRIFPGLTIKTPIIEWKYSDKQ